MRSSWATALGLGAGAVFYSWATDPPSFVPAIEMPSPEFQDTLCFGRWHHVSS